MTIESKKYRFIKINAKDNGVYTDIALLVDNTDFLDEVEAVRSTFGINYKFPVDYYKAYGKIESGILLSSGLHQRFDNDVERIRKMFHLPPHYTGVIKDSIIYGEVSDGKSYNKAYLELIPTSDIEDEYDIPDIKYAIIIHARTRPKDVEKVFHEFQERVRINFRATDEDKEKLFGYWEDLSIQKLSDTKGSIRRYSRQYRNKLDGKNPLDLALEKLHISKQEYKGICSRENANGDRRLEIYQKRDSIKQEISDYKRLLKTWNL